MSSVRKDAVYATGEQMFNVMNFQNELLRRLNGQDVSVKVTSASELDPEFVTLMQGRQEFLSLRSIFKSKARVVYKITSKDGSRVIYVAPRKSDNYFWGFAFSISGETISYDGYNHDYSWGEIIDAMLRD